MEKRLCDHPSNEFKESKMDTEEFSSNRVDLAAEVTTQSMCRPHKKVSVTQNIVFCIDSYTCQLKKLTSALAHFITTKKLISTATIEFKYVIYSSSTVSLVSNIEKLLKCSGGKNNDIELFDLSPLFNYLAERSELPNPRVYSLDEPPFHYHFIVLYGSNDSIPILKSPNSYYYLINNPFVTIDVLHLKKGGNSGNSEKISEILQCLVSSQNGHFSTTDIINLYQKIIKFVGNPLLR